MFFVCSVRTAGLEPYHISIGCGFFHLKRLRIRCAIVVSTWQNAIIAALILRFDSTGDAQTGRRASQKTSAHRRHTRAASLLVWVIASPPHPSTVKHFYNPKMSSKRKKEKEERGSNNENQMAFLSRVRGKWTCFRSRAAFGRSDRNWTSGNWDWTGHQLRLSPFRIRVLSPRGLLLPATLLWVLPRTVILLASRASSVFPA